MQTYVTGRKRPLLALVFCAGLVLVGAAGVFAAANSSGSSYQKKGTLHCVSQGGYTYTFDAVWRVESLQRLDPATRVASPATDPDRIAVLRASLLQKLKVERVEAIPVEGKEDLAAIHALGYF
jgi:hypothetical protein